MQSWVTAKLLRRFTLQTSPLQDRIHYIHHSYRTVREVRLCVHPLRLRGRQGSEHLRARVFHFDHGVGLACSAAARVPPRRPSLGIPFWLVWPFSVPHTRLHLMPRLAASGPISRLGPLSLLHWVFLLRPVRLSRSPLFRTPSLFLFACSRIACNCSLIFLSFQVGRGRSLDWCRASCCCLTLRLSWSFRADTLAGCLRMSHVLYFGYAVHALKGSSFFLI